jgi:bifunctional DNase/RNase
MIEMLLSRIVIRESSDHQAIYLRERGGSREFRIVIGVMEAMAIDRRVRERTTARPMTHDLLANVVRSLGATLDRVVVSDLKDNTFFARLVLNRPDQEQPIEVDARPSDAISLAVSLSAPIFVEDSVLDAVVPEV